MTAQIKTTEQHVQSAAKYVVPSATGAWALTEIIIFLLPTLDPISEPILALITIGINLLSVYLAKTR